MAAVNFPTSPSTGTSHSENGKSWIYDGTRWVMVSDSYHFGKPNAPVCLFPIDDESANGTQFEISSYQHPDGVPGYCAQVQRATDANFTTNLEMTALQPYAGQITDVSMVASDPDTTTYWRSRYVDVFGKYSEWSQTQSYFSVTTYANYVTFLLKADGTNGATNATFLDSSILNNTVTRIGETTQGTFSPFSVADGRWSAYFDGTDDYTSVAHTTALNIWDSGAGAFTIEGWALCPVAPTNNIGIVNKAPNNTSTSWSPGWCLSFFNNYINVNLPNDTKLFTGQTATVPLNRWFHFALVKNGATVSLFQEGTRIATATNANAYSNTTDPITIGTDRNLAGGKFTGYFSGIHLVKGEALYDPTLATLTVPTQPSSIGANTVLMTLRDAVLRDRSANDYALTHVGNTMTLPYSPYATNQYDTAYGGSAYFNGTSDALTVPATSSISGTGDFTAEFFVRPHVIASGYRVLFANQTSSGLLVALNSTGTVSFGRSLVAIDGTTTNAVRFNAWNHVAVSRVSGTLRVFINGKQGYSGANSTSFASGVVSIGVDGDMSSFRYNGFLSNMRFTNGTGLYTANFAIPTSPLTTVSGTSMLLNFTNGSIIDSAGKQDIIVFGAAALSTTQVKYGTTSIALLGGSNYLRLPPRQNLAFGTGNFTIQFWVNPSSFYDYITILSTRTGVNTTSWSIGTQGAAQMLFYAGSEIVRDTTPMSAGTWYHFAFVRNNGVITGYRNGVSFASVANTYNFTSPDLLIGRDLTFGEQFTGYLDDIKISNYAEYTGNFTPPSAW